MTLAILILVSITAVAGCFKLAQEVREYRRDKRERQARRVRV